MDSGTPAVTMSDLRVDPRLGLHAVLACIWLNACTPPPGALRVDSEPRCLAVAPGDSEIEQHTVISVARAHAQERWPLVDLSDREFRILRRVGDYWVVQVSQISNSPTNSYIRSIIQVRVDGKVVRSWVVY